MARSVRPRLQKPKALLAPATDNWLSRAYLGLVGVSLGFFLWAVYLSPDPGFAGIWPTLATAPLGMIVSMPLTAALAWNSSLDWLSPVLFSAGTVLCGLVNATLIGLFARKLTGREPYPAA
ncbi:hypothetical protein [Streptomyces sp. S.PB5]|uniref:SCO4225 family membrane protein n=1 Tax=Streptomyces sp. S.PB5 TaxID=3020844 RepID=UPI0025AF5129|nr:hypothetical protein [Streptomyces sp. S.PB5]MDN3028876.1 hypothetical protein [Streptomyces sp. S.PB5]